MTAPDFFFVPLILPGRSSRSVLAVRVLKRRGLWAVGTPLRSSGVMFRRVFYVGDEAPRGVPAYGGAVTHSVGPAKCFRVLKFLEPLTLADYLRFDARTHRDISAGNVTPWALEDRMLVETFGPGATA